MIQPLISVIVPIYNGEKYLEECIESILKQTVGDWELILVNDGSIDRTENICKKYVELDKRIVYIKQENSGVSVARNSGIQLAKGKWITFLDADDTLADFTFEIVKASPKNGKVVMAGFAWGVDEFFKSEEYVQVSAIEMQKAILNLESFKKRHRNLEVINDYNNWSSCAHFFDTEFIKKHTLLFTKGIRLGEDLLFCLGVYNGTEKVYVNKSKLYYYRTNEDSATMQFRPDLVDNTYMLTEAVENKIKERPDLWSFFCRFVVYQLSVCYYQYYMDPRCAYGKDQAYSLFINMSRKPLFKRAIEDCTYSHIITGKKNKIKAIILLFCVKKQYYGLLKVLTPFILKICK